MSELVLRYAKWVGGFIILALIVIFAAHINRDRIARNFADSMLRGQGIIAREISVERLDTDRVTLSRLVLEQEEGTRYVLSGLEIPLVSSASGVVEITVRQAEVYFSLSDGASPRLSDWLGTVLQLPETLPNTEIIVDDVLISGMPRVENASWSSVDGQQRLILSVGMNVVSIFVERSDAGEIMFRAAVNLNGNTDALTSSLVVERLVDGYRLDGTASMDLSAWLSTFHEAGLVPAEISAIDARIDGIVSVLIHDDATLLTQASYEVEADDGIRFTYSLDDGQSINVQSTFPEPVLLLVDFPTADWSVRLRNASSNVTLDDQTELQVLTKNMKCQAGPSCALHADISSYELSVGGIEIASAFLSAPINLSMNEEMEVDIGPDSEFVLTEVSAPGFSVELIESTHVGSIEFSMASARWHGNADEVAVVARSIKAASQLQGMLSISFSDVVFGDNKLKSSLQVSQDENAISALADIDHNLATGHGTLSVHSAKIDFRAAALSSHFITWPYNWDIVSGAFTAKSLIAWDTSIEPLYYEGELAGGVNSLSGRFGESTFSGLSTSFEVTIHDPQNVAVSPMTLTVDLLDPGIPLENLFAKFEFDISKRIASASEVSTDVLGGTLLADPLVFDLNATANTLILRPKSLVLQQLVDRADIEGLSVTGSVSGELPITISEDGITISDGKITSDSPGGTIRYSTESAVDADDAGLGLVMRALNNFQYESLDSIVDYTLAGDLVLQTRLAGISPDLDETQPVILNLNIEDNIPALLRSLQVAGSIQEALDESVNQER